MGRCQWFGRALWTRLRREGSEGSEGSKGSEGKVLKMDRPDGRRVLKFDGAFGPEGCGIALSGNAYEVSVTGFAFLCHTL